MYAAPRSPLTQIRSVGLAPERNTALPLSASPMQVMEMTSPEAEAEVSPPTRSTP